MGFSGMFVNVFGWFCNFWNWVLVVLFWRSLRWWSVVIDGSVISILFFFYFFSMKEFIEVILGWRFGSGGCRFEVVGGGVNVRVVVKYGCGWFRWDNINWWFLGSRNWNSVDEVWVWELSGFGVMDCKFVGGSRGCNVVLWIIMVGNFGFWEFFGCGVWCFLGGCVVYDGKFKGCIVKLKKRRLG